MSAAVTNSCVAREGGNGSQKRRGASAVRGWRAEATGGLAHISLLGSLQAIERLHLAPKGGRPAVPEAQRVVGVGESQGEAAELDSHEGAVGQEEGAPRGGEGAGRQTVEQLDVAPLRRLEILGLGLG